MADPANAAIRKTTSIGAQGLAPALQLFAKERDMQVVYRSELVIDRQTPGASGDLTVEETLTQLLNGTGLTFQYLEDKGVTIVPVSRSEGTSGAPAPAAQPTRLAQADQSGGGTQTSGDGEPSKASPGALSLEEVVVTARKEEESLQAVPLAITAISADMLEKANVRSIAGIVALTPGLSLQGDGLERGLAPNIRGLSFSGDTGQEGNVAVMLDGIYIANPGAMSLSTMVFERVEVVKGPQSALYGHNAFAGAINYVSKAPPDELEAKVEARAGNYDAKGGMATLGGPIVDGLLSARAAISFDEAGGTYKDPVNGKELGGWEKKGANFLARLTPNDWSAYDFGLYYGDDDFGRPIRGNIAFNCAEDGGEFTYVCGELPSGESVLPLVAPTFEPENASGNSRKVKHARLKATYDLEQAKVEVIAGMFDVESYSFSELFGERDGLEYDLVGEPAGTVTIPGFFGSEFNNKDYSGEIRVSSNQDQRLRWSTGVYYYRNEQDVFAHIAFNSDPIPPGRSIVCPAGYACQWLSPGASKDNVVPTHTFGVTKQASAFVGLSFDVTDRLDISGEARYTKEEKFNDVLSNAVRPTEDPDGPNGQSAEWSFWNPRFTANFELTPEHFLYASAAKGTKAGGFNPRATLADELAYGPEENWTYEIGSKNTLWDGRLRLNVALFSVSWSDLQISVPSADTANVGDVTRNYGSVTARGGEIEIAAQLFDGVVLHSGVAYTNPEFDSGTYDFGSVDLCLLLPDSCGTRVVNDAPSPAGPVTAVNLDGLLRPEISEWQYTLGLDITRPLRDTWGWFVSANYKYESKQFSEIVNETWIAPRHLLGMQIGVENDNWRVSLWGQNLTDDLTPYSSNGGGAITRYNDFSSVPRIEIPDRRRYGATVSYTF